MLKILLRLKKIFKKEDIPALLGLFLGIILNSVLEILGIGLILPFIALLGKPGLLETNAILGNVYAFLHCGSFTQFMIFIAAGIIGVFVLKNLLLFFVGLRQSRFILRRQAQLSARLLRAYLLSPYSFHLSRNLAQMQRNLGLVVSVMQGVVLPMFNSITEAVLILGLFSVLAFKYPLLTGLVAVTLVAGLAIFFFLVKNKLSQWGGIYNHYAGLLTQQVNQGLGSIKETKLMGKEDFFIARYALYGQECARQMTKADVVTKSPRLFIETIVVAMIMGVMIWLLSFGTPSGQIFTIISLFAIVALRLMPSLNRISSSWTSIKFYLPSLEEVYGDLVYCEGIDRDRKARASGGEISFARSLDMRDVGFSYENAKVRALDHVSLSISKNSTVGFVGASGAGKTTAIDLILGLLEPTEGSVTADGKNIHDNLRAWQNKLAYIPQAIYLCDDTIKNNVALGLEAQEIDEAKVWHALRLAQLEDFVRSLPQGLTTKIGERGVRLSGGQRQRIGIARALYNSPEVLVMDEATAALDNETERAFMDSLELLTGGMTILIIAHRLSTVRHCDKIFLLKSGNVIADGTYDQLLEQSPEFLAMVGSKKL